MAGDSWEVLSTWVDHGKVVSTVEWMTWVNVRCLLWFVIVVWFYCR